MKNITPLKRELLNTIVNAIIEKALRFDVKTLTEEQEDAEEKLAQLLRTMLVIATATGAAAGFSNAYAADTPNAPAICASSTTVRWNAISASTAWRGSSFYSGWSGALAYSFPKKP